MALGHKSKSVSHMTLLGSHQGIEKGELITLVCREFSFLLAHGHLGTWSPGHLACLVCLAPDTWAKLLNISPSCLARSQQLLRSENSFRRNLPTSRQS